MAPVPASALLPPGPKASFLTGHLPAARADILGFLTACARDHGDFVPLRFGPVRAVLLSHPDATEEVLVTRHRDFAKGGRVRRARARSLVGNGLGVSEGDLWRRQRRLMQPAFHRERLAAYGEVMVACAERMLAGAGGTGGWRDGEVRDVQQDMTRLTLEIVCQTLFDADVAAHADQIGAASAVVHEHFRSRLTSLLFLLPDGVPTPGNLRYQRAVRCLDRIVYGMIDARRADPDPDRGDLLSMLLHARDEAGGCMTERQVRDEVITLLLAGHQTTALALTWTWYLLAQHPQAEARLAAEVRDVLGTRRPSAADVPRLRYVEMAVTEALRLYPPGIAVTREAVRDCEVAGYHVAAGTNVVMSQWVTHRDPRYFDDPEAFRPERWAAAERGGHARPLPKFAFFPFGGGQRTCIGGGFAMLEAVLLVATIARRFRLTLAPGAPVVPHVTYTLRPRDGLKVALHGR
jgi:cytochrome P450